MQHGSLRMSLHPQGLEKQRQSVSYMDKTHRDFLDVFHSKNDNPTDVRKHENQGETGEHAEERKHPWTGGGGGFLIIGDSVLKQVDRWVANPHTDCMVVCLLCP